MKKAAYVASPNKNLFHRPECHWASYIRKPRVLSSDAGGTRWPQAMQDMPRVTSSQAEKWILTQLGLRPTNDSGSLCAAGGVAQW